MYPFNNVSLTKEDKIKPTMTTTTSSICKINEKKIFNSFSGGSVGKSPGKNKMCIPLSFHSSSQLSGRFNLGSHDYVTFANIKSDFYII